MYEYKLPIQFFYRSPKKDYDWWLIKFFWGMPLSWLTWPSIVKKKYTNAGYLRCRTGMLALYEAFIVGKYWNFHERERFKVKLFYTHDFLVFAARNNDKITLIHIGPEKSFKSCQIMEKSLKISFRVKGIKVWENIYSLNKWFDDKEAYKLFMSSMQRRKKWIRKVRSAMY